MYWCCPSSTCVVLLACVHLALYLALSLSPGFLLFPRDVASFLALAVSNSSLFTPALLRTHSFVFLLSTKPTESFSVLSSQRHQDVFLHCFRVSSFHNRMLLQATLALSLVASLLKSVCCDFSIFSPVMPRLPAPCLTWPATQQVTTFCNKGPKVQERINLLQLLILNK